MARLLPPPPPCRDLSTFARIPVPVIYAPLASRHGKPHNHQSRLACAASAGPHHRLHGVTGTAWILHCPWRREEGPANRIHRPPQHREDQAGLDQEAGAHRTTTAAGRRCPDHLRRRPAHGVGRPERQERQGALAQGLPPGTCTGRATRRPRNLRRQERPYPRRLSPTRKDPHRKRWIIPVDRSRCRGPENREASSSWDDFGTSWKPPTCLCRRNRPLLYAFQTTGLRQRSGTHRSRYWPQPTRQDRQPPLRSIPADSPSGTPRGVRRT